MGACTFTNFGRNGETNAQKAFAELTEQARYESGHGGYTGTIAEKPSFVVVQEKAVEPKAAVELAGRLIDEGDRRIDNKWGPAGAIRVQGPSRSGKVFDGWLFFGWASE